jgi:hypothetical protein
MKYKPVQFVVVLISMGFIAFLLDLLLNQLIGDWYFFDEVIVGYVYALVMKDISEFINA